jgi:O-antigen/teichoic acid export membrane protein
VRAGLGSPHLRRIAGNTGWLIAERLLRGLIAVTVTVAVARYLGPSDFGILNYALSFVLLFGTFWTLGLSGIVIRELVREPEHHDEILGTLFVLRLMGGTLGVLAILVAASNLVSDGTTRAAIAVIGVATLFYAFDGVDYWLQAEVRSRYAVIARALGLLVMACVSVGLIALRTPVLAFAAAAGAEFAAAGVALLGFYVLLGRNPLNWRPDWRRARYLVGKSWPLLLSGAMYSVNLKIDQLMLGNMVGSQSVGTYAAAARLSEVWYFIPAAIAASTFPSLIQRREAGADAYQRYTQRIYDLMVWIALPLALFVTLASGSLVGALFGADYAVAGGILAIHIWAGPFVFLGAVLSRWLIAEDLLRFSLVRHGVGATVNIGVNLALIPVLGGVGAAVATLISYAVASYGACLLYRPTWPAARQMSLALIVPLRAGVSLVATMRQRWR